MRKYRHEIKYKINYGKYLILRTRLKNAMKLDNNASNSGEYEVTSLYLDDIYNTALYEKNLGLYAREKYRIRIYNNSDKVILLEKKIKRSNYVAKDKVNLSKEEYLQILNGNVEEFKDSNKELLIELGKKMKERLLKPVVIVTYTREAYVEKNGNVRITFDKRLRTGLNKIDLFSDDLTYISALDNNEIILEVKYDEYLPEYIRNLLQIEGATQQSVSKYAICRKYTKMNSWEEN